MSWKATAWAERQVTGSAARKALLLILANYADEHGKCWPSQETIARGTELSTDTVQRQTRKLVDLGLISIERQPKRRGQWGGFVYQLHMADDATRPHGAARSKASEPVDKQPDLRPGRAAMSTATRPQALRHKPSKNLSVEPSRMREAISSADRLQDFRGKQEGSEVVQHRIAQRLGHDGWLILGGMSDAQRARITTLERRGELDDATLASAVAAARQNATAGGCSDEREGSQAVGASRLPPSRGGSGETIERTVR